MQLDAMPKSINELSPDQITTLKAAHIAKLFNLKEAQRAIYECYRKFMNNKSFEAEVGIETVAKLCGYCRNTVKKHLKILEEKGILWFQEQKYIKKDGGSWNKPHKYTFIYEKLGKQKQIEPKKKTLSVKSTAYQEKKEAVLKAREEIKKQYPVELAERVFKQTIANIRKGYHVFNPLSYMKGIAENMSQSMKLGNDPELLKDSNLYESNESRDRKTVFHAKDKKISKTKFHNFEQRSSKYTDQEIEKMIKRKNRL